MTSGGWPSQEPRHGRHRQGSAGAAWTPVVRPTDSGHAPAHAKPDSGPDLFTPARERRSPAHDRLTGRTRRSSAHERLSGRLDPAPDLFTPAHERRSPAHKRPDLFTPAHERPSAVPARRVPDLFTHANEGLASLLTPAHARPEPAELVPPRARRGRSPGAGRRETEPDAAPETIPLPFARRGRGDTGPIAYAVPDTPATGLRKFDLGTVPASVTPPRSWRRAAWFAVGTSAAVVLGLAFAAAELVGRPAQQPLIDALPAYPTGPLTLDRLPVNETSALPTTPKRHSDKPTPTDTAGHSEAPQEAGDQTTGQDNSRPGDPVSAPGGGTGPGTLTRPTEPARPIRTTVGPAPVTPTNPAAMGDTTEAFYRLVTEDPAAAHTMTTGDMARAGAAGIEARYAGVDRVEVQQITIDRNQATTTSVVKIVRTDGTETVETRRLTFTWGGDPKITGETAGG